MFKRACFALFICIAFVSPNFAGAVSSKKLSTLTDGSFERQLEIPSSEQVDPKSELYKDVVETYKKLPFSVGERVRYVATYLGIKAGTTEMILQPPIKWGNTWAHRVTGEVKNADWYKWVAQIHDAAEGVFDKSMEMGPLRFYINQQEPVNFKQTKILNFDLNKLKVEQKTQRKERELKRDTFDILPGTKDALGALYYLRVHTPHNKDVTKIEFPIFTSEKVWQGNGIFLREEKITVEGNTYLTDVYKVFARFGGLMEQKGDITTWVTQDERRLMVYAEANIKFGYVKLSLQEWDQGEPGPDKKVWPAIRPAN